MSVTDSKRQFTYKPSKPSKLNIPYSRRDSMKTITPEINRKAALIKSDPRFVGTFEQAVEIALELENGVKPDSNAMRRTQ